MSTLNVFLGEQHVGILSQDAAGELRFDYLPGATSISVSLTRAPISWTTRRG